MGTSLKSYSRLIPSILSAKRTAVVAQEPLVLSDISHGLRSHPLRALSPRQDAAGRWFSTKKGSKLVHCLADLDSHQSSDKAGRDTRGHLHIDCPFPWFLAFDESLALSRQRISPLLINRARMQPAASSP
ncbi:hypothetical protein LIA77_03819 [Sarocladium implicatum]|nr:hypothetical protein LIA77_03819 [Sarocladium implicatum]